MKERNHEHTDTRIDVRRRIGVQVPWRYLESNWHPVAGLVRQAIDQWLRRVHDGEEELPGWFTRSLSSARTTIMRAST